MKKAFLLISALTLSVAMHAQSDKRDAVVNIENGYTPEEIPVGKLDIDLPSKNRDISIQQSEAEFSKVGILYTGFTSERDIKNVLPKRDELFPGYARIGYGVTNDIDAKVAYRLDLDKYGILDAYTTFDGFKCNVGGLFNKWNSRFFNNETGVGYKYDFSLLSINADAKFSNNVFNYQNTDSESPFTNKQNSRNYLVSIGGTSNLAGPFSYKFNGDYEYIARSYAVGKKNGIGENRFGIGGSMGYDIYSKWVSTANLDLRLDAFIYDRTLRKEFKGYGNYFSIDFDPSVTLNFSDWEVNVGFNMNFVTKGAMVCAIAPNISTVKNFNKYITA